MGAQCVASGWGSGLRGAAEAGTTAAAANALLQYCEPGGCCRCCSLTQEHCMLLAAAGGKDKYLRVWTQDGQQLQKLELGEQ